MLSFIRARERIQKVAKVGRESSWRNWKMDGTCYGAVNTRMKVGFLFRLVSLDVERTGHRPAIALFSELTGGSFLTWKMKLSAMSSNRAGGKMFRFLPIILVDPTCLSASRLDNIETVIQKITYLDKLFKKKKNSTDICLFKFIKNVIWNLKEKKNLSKQSMGKTENKFVFFQKKINFVAEFYFILIFFFFIKRNSMN